MNQKKKSQTTWTVRETQVYHADWVNRIQRVYRMIHPPFEKIDLSSQN
jgi:hypothetical protein